MKRWPFGLLLLGLSRGLAAAPPEAPVYRCHKTAPDEIAPAGGLTDTAWARRPAVELVEARAGGAPRQRTVYRLAWNDESLFVRAEAADTDIVARHTEHDGRLWEDDCLEFFVNPSLARETPYFEFQANPRGAHYDSLVFDRRKVLNPLYEQAWKRNYEPAGIRAAVSIRADGWTVEFVLPLAALTLDQPLLPESGQRWRAALFRVDRDSKGGVVESAWRPIASGRFHDPAAFGILEFASAPDGPKPGKEAQP